MTLCIYSNFDILFVDYTYMNREKCWKNEYQSNLAQAAAHADLQQWMNCCRCHLLQLYPHLLPKPSQEPTLQLSSQLPSTPLQPTNFSTKWTRFLGLFSTRVKYARNSNLFSFICSLEHNIYFFLLLHFQKYTQSRQAAFIKIQTNFTAMPHLSRFSQVQ